MTDSSLQAGANLPAFTLIDAAVNLRHFVGITALCVFDAVEKQALVAKKLQVTKVL
jgi:predicted RNA-binding protein with PIN domain